MATRVQRIPLTGGANQLLDQRDIDDSEFVSGTNIVPTSPGRLGKRKGLGFVSQLPALGTTSDTGFYSKPVFGVFAPSGLNATGCLLAVGSITNTNGGGVTFDLRTYSTLSGGGGIAGVATQSQAVFTNTYGPVAPRAFIVGPRIYVLVGANANQPGYIIQARADGSPGHEIINWTWTTGQSYGANAMTIYKNRAVYFNLGTVYQSAMVFADIDGPATLGPAFTVGSNDSDTLVGGIEIIPTGTGLLSQSNLLIFKQRSTYLYTGEPGTSTSVTVAEQIGTLSGGQVQVNTGCISAQTIVRTPFGILWCGHDDVWLFEAGQLPVRVGTKLRNLITKQPVGSQHMLHAVFHNGFYKLALCTPGRDLNAFNPPSEQWWLDLRAGAPQGSTDARWYGPQVFKTSAYVEGASSPGFPGTSCMFENFNHELFAVAEIDPGTTSTQMYQALLQFDVNDGQDVSNKTFDSGGLDTTGAIYDSKNIQGAVLTKEYDFGNDMLDKTYIGMQCSVAANRPLYMQVTATLDGGADVDTATKVYDQNGFILDLNVADTPLITRQFVSQLVTPDVTKRHQGKTLQFTVGDAQGYVLDSQMTDFTFQLVGVTYHAVLTPGLYASLVTALDHVMAQMLAISGTTFTHNQTTAINRPALVAITQPGLANWRPLWTVSTESTKRLCAMLGYDTSAAPSSASTQTAANSVPLYQALSFDVGGLAVMYNPIPRDPA